MGLYDDELQCLLTQAEQQGPLPLPKNGGRMYAITFDLDTQVLQAAYGKPSWQHAYDDIKAVLFSQGFFWQQGSVYLGGDTVTAVQCVLATQALSATLPWFKSAVRDIRMLRIEEFNDLYAAL